MSVQNPDKNTLTKMIFNQPKSSFFSQRSASDTWTMNDGIINSLNFDEFEITWANCPEDSTPLLQRFFNADNKLTDNGEVLPKYHGLKFNYREESGYHLLDTIPVDWVKDFGKDRKVLYKYNSDWFRSDHFSSVHNGKHVVFAGCSNTEGVGANIENTWSHMLYTELSNKYNLSGYFNLGRSGNGWHNIVQNYMAYVSKYGAADYLFVLMPNILRDYVWNDETGGWRYNQLNPWGDVQNLESNIKLHRAAFPTWLLSWKLFIKYCESIGTTVLWSSWDHWETDNLLATKQKTYFPIRSISNEIMQTPEYLELLDREDAVWARDGHDGYIQQYFWFKSFLYTINKRGLIND